MCLSEAAAVWPRLSSISVGSITGGPYVDDEDTPNFDLMKASLLPLMVSMQTGRRALRLRLDDPGVYRVNARVAEEVESDWNRLCDEWERWRAIVGIVEPFVTIERV